MLLVLIYEDASHFVPNITMGMSSALSLSIPFFNAIPPSPPRLAGFPVLTSVAKRIPGIFMDCHMMVAQPEKASFSSLKSKNNYISSLQWLIGFVNTTEVGGQGS